MTNSIVLDAWTILAYLNGRKNVTNILDLFFERAFRGEVKLAISWINVGEVEYILKRLRGNDEAQAVLDRLKLLPVEWFEVTPERIHSASDVKAKGGVSHADAFVIALTRELDGKIFTGDPEILDFCPKDRVIDGID